MAAFNPRAVPPGRLVSLLNSTPAGSVITTGRLRRHREQAGAKICGVGESGLPDFGSVHVLRYVAWLIARRHAAPSLPAGDDAGAKPARTLGPRFSGEGPRFG